MDNSKQMIKTKVQDISSKDLSIDFAEPKVILVQSIIRQMIRKVVDIIEKELPFAQPTRVQDILQYLDEYLHPIVSPEHWSVYSELYDMVSMLPSAQPEITVDGYADGFADGYKQGQKDAQPERKTGKWNFIGDNMFECTSCGVVYTTNQLNGLRNYDTDPYAPKFCPNCGADMRGEQNE